MNNIDKEKSLKVKKKSYWRWFFRLLFLMLILILLFPFIIHLKPVQNWLVDKVSEKFSKTTGSTVEIEKIDFSVFEGLILENAYISSRNAPQDTLAFIGSFSSTLSQNIASLFDNSIYMSALVIKDAHFKIKTKAGDDKSNLEFFLQNFGPGRPKYNSKAQKSFKPELSYLNLEDVSFEIDNNNKGDKLSVKLKKGEIYFEGIYLESDSIVINNLDLLEPQVRIDKNRNEDSSVQKPKQTTSTNTSVNNATIKDASPLFISVNNAEIENGSFSLDDWQKPVKIDTNNKSIDYSHLHIQEVNVSGESIVFRSPIDVKAKINALSLKEKQGFQIENLRVDEFEFNKKNLVLKEFLLKTNNSTIKDYLEFEFKEFNDFKNFAQRINIISEMEGSKIALSDLNYFFPDLYKSAFFRINKNRSLYVTGIVNGTVDNLEADNLYLTVDNLVELSGAISTISLTNSSKALVNLYVNEFNTSLGNLKQIIPGFNPPEQFYKLDPISFTGDIEGFFNDFVIYGSLTSKLGKVGLDSRLDIKDGIGDAKYSGEISLDNFDLKTWTGNPDFGFASLNARIEDGQGLTLETVKTDLRADLKQFYFKGYDYSNISLEGILEKNLFNGMFTADDPNLSLDFKGEIDLTEDIVKSDFTADIRQIDLTALNLSKDISSINGKFDLTLDGSSSKDIFGSLDVKNLELVYREKAFNFDSLFLTSSADLRGNRNVILSSDLINASINGVFDFAELMPSFKNLIYDNHPGWAQKLKINQRNENVNNHQKFTYKVEIKDTKDYLELANVKDLRFKKVNIFGKSNMHSNQFNSNIRIDTSMYKSYVFDNTGFSFYNDEEYSTINLDLKQISTASKSYEPISLTSEIKGDSIELRLKTENVLDSVGQLDLALNLFPDGDKIVANFRDRKLQMFSTDWEVFEDNRIAYGDKFIDFQDLVLTDGNRSVVIDDIDNKGVSLKLGNFDLLLLNPIIDYDKIDFAGKGDVNLKVEDIFNTPIVNGRVVIPEFTLNDEDYGELILSAIDRGDGMVDALVSIDRVEDNMNYALDVTYDKKEETLNGDINIKNGSMTIFEYIIDEGISGTKGQIDLYAKLSGKVDDLKLNGKAIAKNAGVNVDYLDSYMIFGTEEFSLTETYIDLTGLSLYDKYNNQATMTGGLIHDRLKDFEADLTMSSPRFLILDTDKYHGESYYGTGLGEVTVSFLGPFSSMDMGVDAITGEGTVLNIPIEDSYGDFEESFIKFVDRSAEQSDSLENVNATALKLEGINVEMNLTLTQDALVNIIFDEQLNDVIRGRGNGDLRVIVARNGDFNIFGDYEVETGDYLFTAWGIINKPFEVDRGGRIIWTGDPINATLDITAKYADLRVPTNIFLAEYLVAGNAGIREESKRRTPVNLNLGLTGTLYEPVVNFDLELPELQGELRTFADAKIRTLRENEAELNEQVAGLIMFRSFLPSNSLGNVLSSGSSLVQTGYNTLSEFFSNQLSYLLSGFLQEALAENGFISGIDFNIGFNKNSDLLSNTTQSENYLPDEIEVHFKPRFQNDKWGFDYGTSFVNSNNLENTANYLIHDFVLEYFLTSDKRLKLRAYGKWDKEVLNFDNQQKYGIGINYRREFGNLTDFQKSLSDDIKKLKSQGNPSSGN